MGTEWQGSCCEPGPPGPGGRGTGPGTGTDSDSDTHIQSVCCFVTVLLEPTSLARCMYGCVASALFKFPSVTVCQCVCVALSRFYVRVKVVKFFFFFSTVFPFFFLRAKWRPRPPPVSQRARLPTQGGESQDIGCRPGLSTIGGCTAARQLLFCERRQCDLTGPCWRPRGS